MFISKEIIISIKMEQLAPVVLFVYNRPTHTEKTIRALRDNVLSINTILYIFSDGPRKEKDVKLVSEVRKIINTITGFKEIVVIESPINKGLANSVINGVTAILKKHENIIVLEDDIECSPFFLEYMNSNLNTYEGRDEIWSISAYCPNIKLPKSYKNTQFLTRRVSSWGYATWRDKWEKSIWDINEIEGKFCNKEYLYSMDITGGKDLSPMLIRLIHGDVDSWAIRWQLSCYNNKCYVIYPNKSLVRNIGMDGSGVHCGKVDESLISNYTDKPIQLIKSLKYDKQIDKIFLKSFEDSLGLRIRHLIRPILYKLGLFSISQKIFNLFRRS